ncbi:hypothetical protein Mycsm_01768 [Mycobacterium sp. JS623]|nr:hypothetical protein Mycsm_01768 [Mycobacterium sp. JS623]
MNRWQEADLAWDLIDAVSAGSDSAKRVRIIAKIGAGEPHSAIEDLLYAAVLARVSLRANVALRLQSWVDCYAGSPDEPRLRRLVERATQRAHPTP